MVELAIGFTCGFASAMLASWVGFRRGLKVQRPELFAPKKKPAGKVEYTNFNVSAR